MLGEVINVIVSNANAKSAVTETEKSVNTAKLVITQGTSRTGIKE